VSQTSTLPDQQVVTRTIGDVAITLALPADCPIPTIDLSVHTATNADDDAREAALAAFGMTDDDLKGHGQALWCARRIDDGQVEVRAQVFLPVGSTEGIAA
jgi:hypothetical protein